MNSCETKQKAVITGASGFLGRSFVKRLAENDCVKVYALTSRPEILQETIKADNVQYLHKDVLFTDAAGEILADAVVFNCAYPRNSTGEAVGDGLRYVLKVLEAANDHRAKAIVNISSQSVYFSKREEAASETTPVCPETTYAVGKYATELMLESICRDSGIRHTNIRLASLIGPGFDQRIVNRFIKQALETGRLRIDNDKKVFGFLDVDDAVSALCRMLKNCDAEWMPVYNLGGAAGYTLPVIAAEVKKVLKETDNIDVDVELSEGGLPESSLLDTGLFARDFGYEAQTGLDNSIRKIRDGMRSFID